MQNSLLHVLHKCVLAVCVHKHPIIIKIIITFSDQAVHRFLGGGGVVVSEFSVAWGKRGEGRGGQGREGVQLPDSLMDEAVLQSAGPRLETPQSPP